MTQPWIEPRSPGPLENTLTIMPMFGYVYISGENGNKSDNMKIYRDKKIKERLYLEKYLPALNISVFRLLSVRVSY